MEIFIFIFVLILITNLIGNNSGNYNVINRKYNSFNSNSNNINNSTFMDNYNGFNIRGCECNEFGHDFCGDTTMDSSCDCNCN